MDNAEAPPYKEERRRRITQDLKFTGMAHYIGRNHFCRVELVPCLGHCDVSSDKRYITLPPHRLWYLWIVQSGYYYKLPQPLQRQEIDECITTTAFQWRKGRTNGLWLHHPLDIVDDYTEGEPLTFPSDHNQETQQVVYREQGFVYIIGAAGLDRVRIGWTADLSRRPHELVRSSPVPLEFWAILPGTREDETDLQLRFAHLRTHNDWFAAEEDLWRYVEWAKKYWREPGTFPIKWLSTEQLPIGATGIR